MAAAVDQFGIADSYVVRVLCGRALAMQSVAQDPRQIVAVDDAPEQCLFRIQVVVVVSHQLLPIPRPAIRQN